jgi:hypothetical protein
MNLVLRSVQVAYSLFLSDLYPRKQKPRNLNSPKACVHCANLPKFRTMRETTTQFLTLRRR